MLNAVAQLGQDAVGNVGWVLGDEIDADALGADQAHHLLDRGSLQDGEPFLAKTARPAVARMSQATADGAGVAEGESVQLSTKAGALTLPVAITPMPDHVVWLPMRSPGSHVRTDLGAGPGADPLLRP